jgi:hypothetical protein
MSDRPRSAAARAQSTPAFRLVARTGYAVNGLLNILIGGLALGVVGTGSASPDGALSGLASAPFGLVVVVVVVIGLAALAVWQIVSAILEGEPDARRRWMSRAKLVGKGVAYGALAAVGIRVALQGSSGGGGTEEDLTARLLSTPGGVVLVVLLGVGVLAVGGYLVVKGVRRGFLDDLTPPSGAMGTATTVVGVVGYVARGVAFAVIGVLFVVAAVRADPEQAGGLDDALAALAGLPFGQVLLVAIAGGFVAFGIYSIVRARFAKLS